MKPSRERWGGCRTCTRRMAARGARMPGRNARACPGGSHCLSGRRRRRRRAPSPSLLLCSHCTIHPHPSQFPLRRRRAVALPLLPPTARWGATIVATALHRCCCHRVAVTPSIAVHHSCCCIAVAPYRCRHRRPPPPAFADPFVGWLLRCFPPSAFVIACCHATIDALVASRFCRQSSSTANTAATAAAAAAAGPPPLPLPPPWSNSPLYID